MPTCSRVSKEPDKSEEDSPSAVDACHFGSNDHYASATFVGNTAVCAVFFAMDVPLGGMNGAVWRGHEA